MSRLPKVAFMSAPAKKAAVATITAARTMDVIAGEVDGSNLV